MERWIQDTIDNDTLESRLGGYLHKLASIDLSGIVKDFV